MHPIFKFTVVNSELSTSEQCRHMRNMAGLCRTSHIRLWEKVRKRTVPDLRKTNRTPPRLSPFFSVNLLRVDPKKDFAFEVLITACAKYDVLVTGSESCAPRAAAIEAATFLVWNAQQRATVE